MHRREFLNSGVMATLAASVLGDVTLARSAGRQAPATPPPAAGAAQRRDTAGRRRRGS